MEDQIITLRGYGSLFQGRSTMEDVAVLAKVCKATVSMVLNNDQRITEGTRAKVLTAVRELNYSVNERARALALQKKRRTILGNSVTAVLVSVMIFLGQTVWAGPVTVTSGTTYQTISGFGAASVWVESKVTAALATQFWTDDSNLPPASQVNGNVGLSILRIYISELGSTSNFTTAINSAKQAVAINPNMVVSALVGVHLPA